MNFSLIHIALAAAMIMGCAHAKPFDYHSGTEIPKGPGLFSKEKGEFTIYDADKDKSLAREKAPAAAAPTTATGLAANPAAHQAASDAKHIDGNEQFRQFEQMQVEQKEFETFQQWKHSPANAEEFQEFQEWKRWKAYKQWQESQQTTK